MTPPNNPPIIISDRLGSEAEIISSVTPEVQSLFFGTKEVVLGVYSRFCPNQSIYQWSSVKEGTVGFGFGEAKMKDLFCYLKPIKAGYLNLGFFWASKLNDPNNILEGTGKNLRHIKISGLEVLQNPSLIDILEQSIRERLEFLSKK